MDNFRGDLGFLHDKEGHAGKPYWISNYKRSSPYNTGSGLTLDPGVDLGYVEPALFRKVYKPFVDKGVWSDAQYKALENALGLKGLAAKNYMNAKPILKTIRIGKKQAEKLLDITAIPYWNAITRRFPGILEEDVPGEIHTVMLSLAYNRGAYNKHLSVLFDPIKEKDWDKFADLIDDMQNGTIVESRRDDEADLIRKRKPIKIKEKFVPIEPIKILPPTLLCYCKDSHP